MAAYVESLNVMPVPPVAASTEYFEAGAVTFGVEYRFVNAEISAANRGMDTAAAGGDRPQRELEDRGVSLHVFGREDGGLTEHLRFDCFDDGPHFHYISWKQRTNERVHLDPVAEGDALGWTLERLKTRLPQMLARAGAADLARRVDVAAVADVLPRLAESAYRARFHSDRANILQNALKV